MKMNVPTARTSVLYGEIQSVLEPLKSGWFKAKKSLILNQSGLISPVQKILYQALLRNSR